MKVATSPVTVIGDPIRWPTNVIHSSVIAFAFIVESMSTRHEFDNCDIQTSSQDDIRKALRKQTCD